MRNASLEDLAAELPAYAFSRLLGFCRQTAANWSAETSAIMLATPPSEPVAATGRPDLLLRRSGRDFLRRRVTSGLDRRHQKDHREGGDENQVSGSFSTQQPVSDPCCILT